MSIAEKSGSKYLAVNAIAKRAVQLEKEARRRLEFENRNPLTRAIEELDQGILEVRSEGEILENVGAGQEQAAEAAP